VNEDGETGVGDAAERGEADGGGAESRGSPECRRRRAPTAVGDGQRRQNKIDEERAGKRLRRCTTLPGAWWCGQGRRRMAAAAGIRVFPAEVGDGIGEFVVELERHKSIPFTRTKRRTQRS
jgi:hypothetical protein